jgi:phosphoglycolate phosphatase
VSVVRGVIFDFDGTLADTLPDLTDAVNFGLRQAGLAAQPAEHVREWIGSGIVVLCERALEAADGGHVSLEDYTRTVSDYYAAHRLDKTRPFPGIPELLDAVVARRIPMAVLSNKPHEHTPPLVEALFAKWPWTAIQGYVDEPTKKPNPGGALLIAEKMQLPPAEVMMVGDSAVDITTARRGGLVPVGVTWGYRSREELIEAGAAHLIDKPSELLRLL